MSEVELMISAVPLRNAGSRRIRIEGHRTVPRPRLPCVEVFGAPLDGGVGIVRGEGGDRVITTVPGALVVNRRSWFSGLLCRKQPADVGSELTTSPNAPTSTGPHGLSAGAGCALCGLHQSVPVVEVGGGWYESE